MSTRYRARFTYAPRLVRGGLSLDFANPGFLGGSLLPIEVFTEQHTLSVHKVRVPYRDGGLAFDSSKGPLAITVSGVLHGESTYQILKLKGRLVSFLLGGNLPPQPFTFFRYYDTTTNNYRFYTNCYCTSLSFESTTRTVVHLPYSFSFLVPNGRELEIVNTLEEIEDDGPTPWDTRDPEGDGSTYTRDDDTGTVIREDGEVVSGPGSDSGGVVVDPDGGILYPPLYPERIALSACSCIQLATSDRTSYMTFVNDVGTPVLRVYANGDVEYTGLLEQVEFVSP